MAYRRGAADAQHVTRLQRPKIVCLCGSTKFKQEFEEANVRETFNEHVVLSVCCFAHADNLWSLITPEMKSKLDELHKRKIDLADEILVLNVGGYIGDSTKSEIAHAIKTGKKVRWLDPARIPAGYGAEDHATKTGQKEDLPV